MNAQVKTMTALVRRELWEHRAFWTVPTVMASLLTCVLLKAGYDVLTKLKPEHLAEINDELNSRGVLVSFWDQTQAATMAFSGMGLGVGSIMAFVALFYLLDSLYGDRRDRSILFWRSMPVTDVQTVLSKLLTVGVAAPLCAAGVMLAGFIVWGALAAMIGLAAGIDYWWIGLNPVAWLWAVAQLMIGVAGAFLICLPYTGWLMLASAWAPRAPFLWATLPIVGVAILEEAVFDSQLFLQTVSDHFERLFPKMFGADFEGFGVRGTVEHGFRVVGTVDFSSAFLFEPRLWIGIAVGVGLIALAVRARRYRDDATY